MINPRLPICPRCGEPFPMSHPGAMSRMTEARDIEICSACGNDEALRSAKGLPPVPPHHWPIDPSLRLAAEGPVVMIPTEDIQSREDR